MASAPMMICSELRIRAKRHVNITFQNDNSRHWIRLVMPALPNILVNLVCVI